MVKKITIAFFLFLQSILIHSAYIKATITNFPAADSLTIAFFTDSFYRSITSNAGESSCIVLQFLPMTNPSSKNQRDSFAVTAVGLTGKKIYVDKTSFSVDKDTFLFEFSAYRSNAGVVVSDSLIIARKPDFIYGEQLNILVSAINCDSSIFLNNTYFYSESLESRKILLHSIIPEDVSDTAFTMLLDSFVSDERFVDEMCYLSGRVISRNDLKNFYSGSLFEILKKINLAENDIKRVSSNKNIFGMRDAAIIHSALAAGLLLSCAEAAFEQDDAICLFAFPMLLGAEGILTLLSFPTAALTGALENHYWRRIFKGIRQDNEKALNEALRIFDSSDTEEEKEFAYREILEHMKKEQEKIEKFTF